MKLLWQPLTPVTTVDRSRPSRPLASTAVTIVAARRRQPASAVAVDCRHRDGGGGLGATLHKWEALGGWGGWHGGNVHTIWYAHHTIV